MIKGAAVPASRRHDMAVHPWQMQILNIGAAASRVHNLPTQREFATRRAVSTDLRPGSQPEEAFRPLPLKHILHIVELLPRVPKTKAAGAALSTATTYRVSRRS